MTTDPLLIALATLIGLAFGSFANVLIYRIPRDENIAFPASHCPACNTTLRWYHNIPLLSYLALRGRCGFCGAPISPVYPAVEALSALIMGSITAWHGFAVVPLLHGSVFILLLALSAIDLKIKAVPDSLNLAALTLAVAAAASLYDVVEHLRDALLFAGGFALLRFYVSFLARKEAMGEADIMIAATIGAMVGIKLGLATIFLSALLALPVALITRTRDIQLPYIPFLAAALVIVFIARAPIQAFLTALYG